MHVFVTSNELSFFDNVLHVNVTPLSNVQHGSSLRLAAMQ